MRWAGCLVTSDGSRSEKDRAHDGQFHVRSQRCLTKPVFSRRDALKLNRIKQLPTGAEGITCTHLAALQPRLNHAIRCCEEPCVNESGVTNPCDIF